MYSYERGERRCDAPLLFYGKGRTELYVLDRSGFHSSLC